MLYKINLGIEEDTSVPFFEIVTSFSGLANKRVYAETDEEKTKELYQRAYLNV